MSSDERILCRSTEYATILKVLNNTNQQRIQCNRRTEHLSCVTCDIDLLSPRETLGRCRWGPVTLPLHVPIGRIRVGFRAHHGGRLH